MKIALVIDDSLESNDGVQQYVRTVGEWLAKNGHDVHYVSSSGTGQSEKIHYLSKSVAVRFNKNKLRIPLFSSKRKINMLIKNHTFDVVHVQMPFSPQLSGQLIRKLPDSTALVGTFHIVPFGKLQTVGGKALAKWVKPSLQRIDQIISVSEPARQHARTTYGLQSIRIPNAVNINKFLANNQKVIPGRIVFLGRLVKRKGCKELLMAINKLSKKKKKFELIIAGDGPERKKLENFCKHHKLEEYVKFEGYISEEHKKELLASAQIAVFPALGGESFGIVLLEAMAAGSDVVLAGNNMGYKSVMGVIKEAVVDPKNVGEFANKIELLLEDKNLRRLLYKKQQKLVKQYDIDTVGPLISDVYNLAIEKRGS